MLDARKKHSLRKKFIVSKVARRLKIKFLSQKIDSVRHKEISKYLTKEYNEVIDLYSLKKDINVSKKIEKNLFVFWWQGYDSAPEIVKKCIDNIYKYNVDKNIIFIDKDNLQEYVDFPEYIYRKLENDVITITQFSDILRFYLITNYGGIWLDATLYTTEKISEHYFEKQLFTSGPYKNESFFVANGRWTGFFIGGAKNNLLSRFLLDIFLSYWKNENELIDYFLIDYFLDIAYSKNIGNFKHYLENKGQINPNLFELEKCLGVKFNENVWREINLNTSVFKLNYKKKIDENADNFLKYILQKK